ncbi:MAG TPA: hypothetical protein VIG33_01060 [Pseudobdellovibrionaceae bacterium]|jgi:aminopeptidase N
MLKALMNTLTLVLSLSFSFSAHAFGDENTETKIQAQVLMNAGQMQTEASILLKEISDIVTEVGTSMEDSGGFLKALGVNETAATIAKKKIDKLLAIMNRSQSSNKIFKGYSEVETLTREIRALNQDSKSILESLRNTKSI